MARQRLGARPCCAALEGQHAGKRHRTCVETLDYFHVSLRDKTGPNLRKALSIKVYQSYSIGRRLLGLLMWTRAAIHRLGKVVSCLPLFPGTVTRFTPKAATQAGPSRHNR
jgi:hypothetical protein